MKALTLLASFCLLAPIGGAHAQKPAASQTLSAAGSQPMVKGPPEHFTGNVRIDPLFPAKDAAPYSGGSVTFEPGSHSNWHRHPAGQHLIVTSGVGRTQEWGGPVVEIRAGDVVWCPPGIKHWHGATPTTAMTHIAITGTVGGKNVDWMEPVTEEQYNMTPVTRTNAQPDAFSSPVTLDDIRAVAPALARYTQDTLADVWNRPGLSARDRSLVTVAVLIARNQTMELPSQLNRALDNGVKPSEVSELITHLAFYSGWGNAISAVPIVKDIFRSRRIGADQLPPVSGPLLPIDDAAEARRAASVEQSAGPVAPGVVQYTSDPLFHDLWLRPALAPRDRSLITVSTLVAFGQVAQMPYHLNRAMDNGLTKSEAAEVLTHLLFYAGWPNVFSSIPIAKDVFEKCTK